jgi:hypothetical protein
MYGDVMSAFLLGTPTSSLTRAGYHFGMGMWIRNNYGLWGKNEALRASCGDARMHPDNCSGIIIKRLWERLQSIPNL